MTVSRRSFLAAAAATPFVVSRAAGEPAEKVRLAVIGVADRGAANLAGVATENIVALCDVDESRAGKAREQFREAFFFTDYRKLFDQMANKIDAVVVSTPDHSHALPALTAMRLGKHVYCEKPLAHSVHEVRLMRETAKAKKVITQMGTQIHAGDNYRRVVEIVQSGALGKVNRVHVWCSRRPDKMTKVSPKPMARTFDPDLWLGAAPEEFFDAAGPSKNVWPRFDWRWWWAFGGGVLADMGCHFTDLPYWALGLGSPTTVTATGVAIPGAENGVPNTLQVDYQFANPKVHLTWYHGVNGPALDGSTSFVGFSDGVLFEGDKAKLVANYNKYQLFPDVFAKDFRAPDPTIPKSVGHHREWLDAIHGKDKPLCEFGYAGTLTETILLGNVAYRTGQSLTWDAVAGKVTNTPTAAQYLARPARKGWDLG